MAASCSYIPHNRKGEELKGFRTYKRELGYSTGAKVFTQVLSPAFQSDYRSSLTMDEQGVPTYESAVRVPYIKNLIGNTRLIEADQKRFPYVEDTRENFQRLVTAAYAYNTSSENRDRLTAVVSPSGDGKRIRVEIRESSEASVKMFRDQYGVSQLNRRIVEILGDLGIDISLLEKNELTAGNVDFSKASSIAEGFAGLINIADGMQGELALSEEFSHLIIGMFSDTPLIQRSLDILAGSESLLKETLGEEYQENMRYYKANPNYDTFGNEVPLERTLAEEALGRILQRKLGKNTADTTTEKPSDALSNLIQRLVNWIKRIFKGKDSDALMRARKEVDASMGELAKGVLEGTVRLSNEELLKNRRNTRFQHLNDRTDKVLQLLRNAVEIERKRSAISPKDRKDDINRRIVNLESYVNDRDKMVGVHTYAKWALADLQGAMQGIDISGTLDSGDFTKMRHILSVLDSYAGFINDFHEALDDLGDASVIEVAGETIDLRELWKEIDDLYKTCSDSFYKQALSAFSDYLAPIYDKSPLRNEDGSIKPLKEVLVGEDFDISEFDRWLTSMGNSSSLLLQLFDKVVKKARDRSRMRTIRSIRDIWKLRDDAERKGITDFEWMFEKDSEGHKTGNYLSEFNEGQYRKDKEDMEKRIAGKYGRHPVGEDFRKAFTERRAWYDSHSDFDIFGNDIPNESYRNPEFRNLTKAQRETLDSFIDYKVKLEMLIPQDRRSRNRAIQRRRSGTQRLVDFSSDPSKAFEGVKEDLKSAFRRSEDDDIMYGERTRGLTDFTGKEYLTLPVLYTGRLKNPDTLSTDVFSDLMAYAYMANNYDEISRVYDPLEIGVYVTTQKDFVKSSDSKAKEEVLNVLGRVSRNIIKTGSNTLFSRKLRDYLECQVYGRYMKEDDILGVDGQKTLSLFQKMTSMAYLGCNYLAGMANVATALGMQNIEAASGEFFRPSTLLKADRDYFKMLPEFIAELGARSKQSELALFDELFDVRQNAKDKLHNTQMNSIFRRFFGNNWLFVQQGIGDHWIYNRTALAMAKERQVTVNGRKMSVWDARQIVTDDNGYRRMVINPAARNEDGSLFDAGDFAREIAHINHTIAGIYNDEDQNAANRVAVGRLGQQMRKWIIPQMMRRFQSKRMNLDTGKEEEGYYRTAGMFAKDLWKSGFKITAEWDKLSDTEKANVRRALTEIAQTYGLWTISAMLGSGIKDPDRSWAMKFAEYMLHREIHELGFLTPGPMMLTEGYKTVTSPFVAASAANSLAQAMLTTMWPGNWFPDDDELIQSGRYEGHSHIYKRWAELPLPPFTQIRQIEKFVDDLDTGTKYYSRDYK